MIVRSAVIGRPSYIIFEGKILTENKYHLKAVNTLPVSLDLNNFFQRFKYVRSKV